MPLTAIADFEKKGKSDPLFAELARICAGTGGLWNAKAERYLLANAQSISGTSKKQVFHRKL
jgi:hypothetical protein